MSRRNAIKLTVKSHKRKDWEVHVRKWDQCKSCPLHNRRTQVVFARGVIPADVLFVGEAPGEAEDNVGRPFINDAGIKLDELVQLAMKDAEDVAGSLDVCFGNAVGCLPNASAFPGQVEIRPPDDHELEQCRQRLVELVDLVEPRLVITLGKTAQKAVKVLNLDPRIKQGSLVHPSHIIRQPPPKASLASSRFVSTLSKWFRSIK